MAFRPGIHVARVVWWFAFIVIASALSIPTSGAQSATVSCDCGPLRLAFDGASGQWVGLWRKGSDLNLLSPSAAPDVEVRIQDGTPFPTPARHLVAHRQMREGSAYRCEVEIADGPWRITCVYRVSAGEPFLRRGVTIGWSGGKSITITGVTLRIPGVGLGGDAANCYMLPSDFPVTRHIFADLHDGRRQPEEGVWANTAEALVYSSRNRVGLVAGYRLDVDGARVVVEERRGAVSIAHEFSTLARLESGDSIDCGEQCFVVAAGEWRDALNGLQRLSDSLDDGPPRDRPAWLDRCAIYSCYPGGSIDTGFRGAGGFGDFEQRLPYLADLGFTALWLNPIHTSPPWIYSIMDYRAVAPELGSKDDLRRFVNRAHGSGMKVLLDLVPHGPNEDTPAAREAPPDAWTCDEAGKLEHAWGGLAGDYASAAWKRYMSDVAAYWVRDFGVDGYRVDCAGGNGPNWKRGDGRRPSASAPLGGLELLQSVRETIRPLNPNAVLFAESWAPIFFRPGDLAYDYPFYQVMRKLVTYPSTEQWIRETRSWLEMERLTYPRMAVRGLVRFTENHDTVRSDEFFGVGPAQALTALCIFAQGTPMIYQDQEIGYGERLRKWLNLRQARPELHSGAADYVSVQCSHAKVFAFLRAGASGAAIVAVNFSGADVTVDLDWPRELSERFPYADCAIGGDFRQADPGNASVTVRPYSPAVVLLSARKVVTAPERKPSAGTGESLLRARDVTPGADGSVEHWLRFAPVETWFVNTNEGLLLDRFLDRHTVEPIIRYDRLWRPLETGLWDGPGNPAIGVIAADGRAVIISGLKLDSLTSVRLEDQSTRGESVRILLRAKGAGPSFQVREVADGWAAVRSLDLAAGREPPSPSEPVSALASVDPLRVVLHNTHYRVAISRRRGGLVTGVESVMGSASHTIPLPSSDLYSDWGLFEGGVRVSADVEATPRMEVVPNGDAVDVTFRGTLRTPSWNGVQRGYPAQPLTRYRITYHADQSPVLRVSCGLTPDSDRTDVKAFYAYVLQFGGVTEWWAETQQGRVTGKPGEHSGTRAFETAVTPLALARPQMGLRVVGREVTVRPIESDGLPQNVFFLDLGDGRLALFVAMLNGAVVQLPAGIERATSFDLVFGSVNPPTAR